MASVQTPDSACGTALEGSGAASVFNIARSDNGETEHDEGEEDRVKEWLQSLGLGRYVGSLQAEGFDHFSIIRDLDDDSIDQLITLCMMPRLHARQLRLGLERLRTDGTDRPNAPCASEIDGQAAPVVDCSTIASGADDAGGIGVPSTAAVAGAGDANADREESADGREGEEEEAQEDAKASLGKKTITLNKKCTKSAEKNKRKKNNKRNIKEQEMNSLLQELRVASLTA